MGAYPPRVGNDWQCSLFIYQVIAGVETLVDMTGWVLDANYWDNVTRIAVDMPIALGAGTGELVITFPDSPVIDAVAGMYNFAVQATDTPTIFDVCSGKLEFLPAMPTV